MSDLVQRLREIDYECGFALCATAADRIEQLERENAELRKDAEKLTPKQMEDFVRLLRNDALEEAAVKCDALVDHIEQERSYKAAKESETTKDIEGQLQAHRHCSDVRLYNCGIEKCAKQIRSMKA